MPNEALNGKTVLVAEEEPFIAMDIETALEKAGARSYSAESWRAALFLLAQQKFDLAVLDMNQGEGNMRRVTGELSRLKIPFVFVTGHEPARPEFREALLLQRPVSSDNVMQALKGLVLEGA